MNTLQIDRILRGDRFVEPLFRGVYARDIIPPFEPGAYVVNTDTSKEAGSHWIALYATPTRVEYFDSYGGDPLPILKRWAKGKKWRSNPVPLQSPLSSVCGQYCIYYLLHRARGISLATMLLDFGKDVDLNDQMVYDFIDDRYEIKGLKLLDTEGLITQLAKARIAAPSIRKLMSG